MSTIYQAVANGAYVTSGRNSFDEAREYARRSMGWEVYQGDAVRSWSVVESRWDSEAREWVRVATTSVPATMAVAPFPAAEMGR
jgi:hypothetical protein